MKLRGRLYNQIIIMRLTTGVSRHSSSPSCLVKGLVRAVELHNCVLMEWRILVIPLGLPSFLMTWNHCASHLRSSLLLVWNAFSWNPSSNDLSTPCGITFEDICKVRPKQGRLMSAIEIQRLQSHSTKR